MKQLTFMLVKSFIVFILTYNLPIWYPSLYEQSKKTSAIFFQPVLQTQSSGSQRSRGPKNRTKKIMRQTIMDDTHFFNNFLITVPCGRYRSLKYRTFWEKNSFLIQPILLLQEIL